ncbi:hypothetical protein J6590_026719 [Homalodisca vitripennis]|nr:hypothetical protein J6590_026719 [Homalodisca vitripennis]
MLPNVTDFKISRIKSFSLVFGVPLCSHGGLKVFRHRCNKVASDNKKADLHTEGRRMTLNERVVEAGARGLSPHSGPPPTITVLRGDGQAPY